jgi:hypothetical protein
MFPRMRKIPVRKIAISTQFAMQTYATKMAKKWAPKEPIWPEWLVLVPSP